MYLCTASVSEARGGVKDWDLLRCTYRGLRFLQLLLVLNKATYSVLGFLIKYKNIRLLYCSYCSIIALLKQIYLKLFRI